MTTRSLFTVYLFFTCSQLWASTAVHGDFQKAPNPLACSEVFGEHERLRSLEYNLNTITDILPQMTPPEFNENAKTAKDLEIQLAQITDYSKRLQTLSTQLSHSESSIIKELRELIDNHLQSYTEKTKRNQIDALSDNRNEHTQREIESLRGVIAEIRGELFEALVFIALKRAGVENALSSNFLSNNNRLEGQHLYFETFDEVNRDLPLSIPFEIDFLVKESQQRFWIDVKTNKVKQLQKIIQQVRTRREFINRNRLQNHRNKDIKLVEILSRDFGEDARQEILRAGADIVIYFKTDDYFLNSKK